MIVSYYVAMSLDGFIAKADGDISWLSLVERDGEDYGYGPFYADIQAVILGRKTFDLCLAFPEWPYAGKRTIVLSKSLRAERHDAYEIVDDSPTTILATLAAEGIEKMWVVGGGEIARLFLEQGILDELIISVIPILLGDGIRLFGSGALEKMLSLQAVQSYPSGLLQMRYTVTSSS